MAAMQNFLLAFSLTVIKTTGARNMKFCMMIIKIQIMYEIFCKFNVDKLIMFVLRLSWWWCFKLSSGLWHHVVLW